MLDRSVWPRGLGWADAFVLGPPDYAFLYPFPVQALYLARFSRGGHLCNALLQTDGKELPGSKGLSLAAEQWAVLERSLPSFLCDL